jgi:1-deoxy-D-xylulose-5-phosphate reductoisomerase
MKKNIVILGSTGSIGSETLKIIKKYKKHFRIKLLSTNSNIKLVYQQAKLFNVKNIIVNDLDSYNKAKKLYKKSGIKFYNNFQIMHKFFKKKEIFYTMISIVGLVGLYPTLRMIKFSQNIAIANKEALICGWNLIKIKLDKDKTNFIPIDSEHFSIFSLLKNNTINNIEKIFITASGGPFLKYNKSKLLKANLYQALSHPNWVMGEKISIDSSTMMNKLFEVIEAKKIFNVPYKKIKILIHPKSYVHAIIKYNDGTTKLLLHEPDMRIPIHNSIFLKETKFIKSNSLNFKILNNLDFQTVDLKKFPLIGILEKLPKNDTLYETALVVINDYYVSSFLEKKITYIELVKKIKFQAENKIFTKFMRSKPKTIKDIYKTINYVNEKLNILGI